MAQDEAEIVIERRGRVGLLTLNRPQALNALSLYMIRTVSEMLANWANDPEITAVILRGAGDRAFCAGGDIKAVYRAGTALPPDLDLAQRYFADEYRLNGLLFAYPKATVALMNGIVMGGGYGLAGQCRFRVACENTQFAMPEVGIGFFPDVGSTWHLARMPYLSGFCLGLTGMTIGQADCCNLGVSTHDIEAGWMRAVPDLIAEALDGVPQGGAAGVIASVLDRVSAPVSAMGIMEQNSDLIARAFAADRAETVLDHLKRDGSSCALGFLTTMEGRSPLSLKVTMAHLHKALQDRQFDETLRRDYNLVCRFLRGHDFYEGIRAAVIDRDRHPSWDAVSLDAVPDERVAALFTPALFADGA